MSSYDFNTKQEIIDNLRKYGIDNTRLFPGLDGLCQEITAQAISDLLIKKFVEDHNS